MMTEDELALVEEATRRVHKDLARYLSMAVKINPATGDLANNQRAALAEELGVPADWVRLADGRTLLIGPPVMVGRTVLVRDARSGGALVRRRVR